MIFVRPKFPEKLRERFIKSFMDVLILTELEREPTMNGYDVVTFIQKEFGIIVSPGTVYSILYSLERNRLIKSMRSQGRRVYSLSDKGKKTLGIMNGAKEELQRLIAQIFRIRHNVL